MLLKILELFKILLYFCALIKISYTNVYQPSMTENERIKQLRKHLGYTQRFFSSSLDIKQGSYSDVERGKAGISAILLKNLIKRYRVNPLWLCEGEGGMFIDEELVNKTYGKPNDRFDSKCDKPFKSKPQNDKKFDGDLAERQQQYFDSINGIIDFLEE